MPQRITLDGKTLQGIISVRTPSERTSIGRLNHTASGISVELGPLTRNSNIIAEQGPGGKVEVQASLKGGQLLPLFVSAKTDVSNLKLELNKINNNVGAW